MSDTQKQARALWRKLKPFVIERAIWPDRHPEIEAVLAEALAAARAEGAREAQLVVTAQCPHCGAYHDNVEIERKS